eukprot:799958_1
MGLGKTVQSLSLIMYLSITQNLRGPFLVLAPKSTLKHWKREFEGWSDLNTIIYDGPQRSRELIREYEIFYSNDKGEHINCLTRFDVMVTSYDLAIKDAGFLAEFQFTCLIVDEAHRLKNTESKLFRVLRKSDNFDHCVFLSGTPIQNNMRELWTLLHFLEPEQFDDADKFEALYGCEQMLEEDEEAEKKENGATDETSDEKEKERADQTEARIAQIHKEVLGPYMLRRTKDVEKSLSPPSEMVIFLDLTRFQKTYCKALFERNADFLYAQSRKDAPSLMNIHMSLRLCCNHPYALKGVEDRVRLERNLTTHEEEMKTLVSCSTKMELLDKFLPKLMSQGHRVLIFSQFLLILNIIEDYLRWRGYLYERIDGQVNDLDKRQASIDRYNEPNSDRFVFLLGTRAGGLGINLTTADTVIIFDSDWNPQNDLQAQARVHRIGQRKPVTIYRLVCRHTYEEVMFQRASRKLGLEKAVLHSWVKTRRVESNKPDRLNKKELQKLLKYGAYYSFKEEDALAASTSTESIEDILARATKVGGADAVEEKTASENILAQATFTPNIEVEDAGFSLDDPDFWSKLGLKAPVEDVPLVRVRKQVKRFQPVLSSSDSEVIVDEDDSDAAVFSDSDASDESDSDAERYANWGSMERRQFEAALCKFGYGRWDRIKEDLSQHSTDVEPRSASEIRAYAIGLIRQYLGSEPPPKMCARFFRAMHADVVDCVVEQIVQGKEAEKQIDQSTSSDPISDAPPAQATSVSTSSAPKIENQAVVADNQAVVADNQAVVADGGAVVANGGAAVADGGAVAADDGAVVADDGAVVADNRAVAAVST